MDQERIDRLKPVYKLWREYLKRSNDYRDLCDYFRRRQQDPSTQLPDKFRNPPGLSREEDVFLHPTVRVYLCFSDVFSIPFDRWWDQFSPKLSELEARKQARGIISDYAEMIESDIDGAVSLFEQEEGRQPTIQELKTRLVQEINTRQQLGVGFYAVNFIGHTAKDIVASFKSVVDKVKSDPIHKKLERYSLSAMWPTIDVLPKNCAMEDYLTVFDAKEREKLPWKAVINKLRSGNKGADWDIKRDLQDKLSKARRIIRNAEVGSFPGSY